MLRTDLDSAPSKKRPPLFWWFLANTLAIAFAITAWIVCLDLFRDPTNPLSYELMMKFGRIESPTHFTTENAPDPQKVNTPRELEARFKSFTTSELEALNLELQRAYLTNFKKAKFLTYVTGEFRITDVRSLSADDYLSPGLVVKAQALIRPDAVADAIPYPVFIECIFPSQDAAPESFEVGQSITLAKQSHCAAVLNVGSTHYEDRDVILVTVVPLAAVKFKPESGATFKITPPIMANPAASLPASP